MFGTAGTTTTPTATPLTGTTYGTVGSYGNQGNTIANATDGNLSTFFDGPTASGGNVGIDLGSAKTVAEIGYAPRSGYASRMVGGVFQVSTSMTFSSNVITVYTITATPTAGVLTTVTPSTSTAYEYWRYYGPANGYCNIAEFELFGGGTTTPTATPLTGTYLRHRGLVRQSGQHDCQRDRREPEHVLRCPHRQRRERRHRPGVGPNGGRDWLRPPGRGGQPNGGR